MPRAGAPNSPLCTITASASDSSRKLHASYLSKLFSNKGPKRWAFTAQYSHPGRGKDQVGMDKSMDNVKGTDKRIRTRALLGP